jgi:hypothetical protein
MDQEATVLMQCAMYRMHACIRAHNTTNRACNMRRSYNMTACANTRECTRKKARKDEAACLQATLVCRNLTMARRC